MVPQWKLLSTMTRAICLKKYWKPGPALLPTGVFSAGKDLESDEENDDGESDDEPILPQWEEFGEDCEFDEGGCY